MLWCGAAVLAVAVEPSRVLELKALVHHVQGIDLDGQRIWLTSVDSESRKGYLHEFSLPDGKLLRSVEVQDGVRFHPGGISADASSIWLPVAEYRRESTSVIQRRSKRTLEVEWQFPVSDHIGCIAVMGGELIGGNWDSRRFYVWDFRGKLLRELPNPTDNAYQDIKFDGRRLIASGLLPDHTGAIDWLEPPAFRLATRVKMGKTDRGAPFTREGMAIRGDELLLLPEDGPTRLFFFKVSELLNGRR
ncbi:MAG TPA: DUF6454 family protein [Bryobacteraceae bacterium]